MWLRFPAKGGGDLGCFERVGHARRRRQLGVFECSPGSRGLEHALSDLSVVRREIEIDTKKDVRFVNHNPFNVL